MTRLNSRSFILLCAIAIAVLEYVKFLFNIIMIFIDIIWLIMYRKDIDILWIWLIVSLIINTIYYLNKYTIYKSEKFKKLLECLIIIIFLLGNILVFSPDYQNSHLYNIVAAHIYFIYSILGIGLLFCISLLIIPNSCAHGINIYVASLVQPTNPNYEKIIDQMQIINYTEDLSSEQCSICLVEYDEDKEIAQLSCKHIFHKECVSPWIKIKSDCPNCREYQLVDPTNSELSV